jgi:hypothetical protein
MRKKKDKIDIPKMDSVFQMNPSKSGIQAHYIRAAYTPDKQNPNKEDNLEIQYLDSKQLTELFFKRKKALNCMVQKFVEPKNDRDHIFKVMWTPQFCLINQITSNHL